MCSACGQLNPQNARFCNSCGAELGQSERRLGEERKVVTVVFVDLVGFTAQAERLDPEDVRGLLAPYHTHVRAELERHGGTVEKFIGDAVMAVFGAPVTHEDDPERAVRAALAIRDWALEEDAALQLRLGINTGEALVTLAASGGEGMAAGDVVNTAARLQAAAPVNGILVGEQTWHATADAIEYAEAAPVVAKGKAAPLPAWVAGRARARFGVDVGQRRLAPLVGRQRELELLASTLGRVREERSPQLVTLVGVPGIGKSRLVSELLSVVEQERELTGWRQGRSLPYGDGVTFWALGEIVKAQADILESDPSDEAVAKLRRAVADLAADAAEAQWLEAHLRPLLGLSDDPSARAGEPFAAWQRFIEALAEQRPLVLVFEDLHWADDALLDFVDQLVDRVAEVPLLVLGTARPELLERRPGWGGGKPNAVSLSLSPLSEEGAARLLAALLDRPVLEADQQQALLAKVGGNPLYAEQYARALVERGELVELPETLQGIIAARLDALADEEKHVLQDAAVVGKVFWAGAVAALDAEADVDVGDILQRLERKQFVQRARRPSVAGELEYAFRHVLLRDVAYGQIPRTARGEKHRCAAEWLQSLGRIEDHAEQIADHYLNALGYGEAVASRDAQLAAHAQRALQEAGDRAGALASYPPAARFYDAALQLAPEDGPGRAGLLLRLGRARFAAESAGGEELQAALNAFAAAGDNEGAAEAALELRMIAWYEGDGSRVARRLAEALELVQERPDSPAKARALVDRVRAHQSAGEFAIAIGLARETLPLVERLGLENLRVRLLITLGSCRVHLGDAGGIRDLEHAIAIAEAAGAFELLHAAQNNLSGAQAFLGDFPQSVRTYEALLEGVDRFGRDTDRRWAHAIIGQLRAAEGRWDEALTILDRFITEVEAGSPHYLEVSCRTARASILLARGDLARAATDSERALAAARAARDTQVLAPALAGRGIIALAQGRRDEAEQLLDELLALGESGVVAAIAGSAELPWLARDLDREDNLIALLAGAPNVPWVTAARAVAAGDFAAASPLIAGTGCRPEWAYCCLRTAEQLAATGRTQEAEEHLDAALAFYRDVGATRYLEQGDGLRRSRASGHEA